MLFIYYLCIRRFSINHIVLKATAVKLNSGNTGKSSCCYLSHFLAVVVQSQDSQSVTLALHVLHHIQQVLCRFSVTAWNPKGLRGQTFIILILLGQLA